MTKPTNEDFGYRLDAKTRRLDGELGLAMVRESEPAWGRAVTQLYDPARRRIDPLGTPPE